MRQDFGVAPPWRISPYFDHMAAVRSANGSAGSGTRYTAPGNRPTRWNKTQTGKCPARSRPDRGERPDGAVRPGGREQQRDVGRNTGPGRLVVATPESFEPCRKRDPHDDRRDRVCRDRVCRSHDRQGTLRPMSPRSPVSSVPETVRRLGKVHHVALIVGSIEDALGLWRDTLGLELETMMDIASDRVRIAFLAIGESKIELVEPTDDSTGVARFLETKGEGFHHVCFEVATSPKRCSSWRSADSS